MLDYRQIEEYYLFTVQEVDRSDIVARFQMFSIQTLEGDGVRKLLHDRGLVPDKFVSDVTRDVEKALE